MSSFASEKSARAKEEEIQAVWNRIGRLNRRGIYGFFASFLFLGLAGLPGILSIHLSDAFNEFWFFFCALMFFFCFLVIPYSFFALGRIKCPRCHELFYGRSLGNYKFLLNRCRGCGQVKGKDLSGWSI